MNYYLRRHPLLFMMATAVLQLFIVIWMFNGCWKVLNGDDELPISSINSEARGYTGMTGSTTLNVTDNKFRYVSELCSNSIASFSTPINLYEMNVDMDFNIDRVYLFGQRNRNDLLRKENKIPRIIHFMWKTEVIPNFFVNNLQTFVKHNPTWKYYFWTDVSCKLFLEENYPQLLRSYKEYDSNISRADAARYAVVYHYGGAYFDLDTLNLKPLDPLLETEECIVAPEPIEHAVTVLNMRSLLANCVFLCKPKHDFFRHVLSELQETSWIKNLMVSAGPIFFTKAFNSYVTNYLKSRENFNDSIHVMSSEYFLDHVKDDVHSQLKKNCESFISPEPHTDLSRSINMLDACIAWMKRGAMLRTLSQKAYTVHVYAGTWAHAKQLENQQETNIKHIIPGARIYPNLQ